MKHWWSMYNDIQVPDRMWAPRENHTLFTIILTYWKLNVIPESFDCAGIASNFISYL